MATCVAKMGGTTEDGPFRPCIAQSDTGAKGAFILPGGQEIESVEQNFAMGDGEDEQYRCKENKSSWDDRLFLARGGQSRPFAE
jgi:hypothetical protein